MALEKGMQAPDFRCEDEQGQVVNLKDFRGKKVVLYFYPKDNTPGCTLEACAFRDQYDVLIQRGFVVLGVSADSAVSHQKFIRRYQLPFPLLVDKDRSLHKAYGTWAEKSMFGRKYMGTLRHTFVIDENGDLLAVIKKVKTRSAAEQVLKEVGV